MNNLLVNTTYLDKRPSDIQDNKQVPISISERLVKEELERLNRNTEELNRLKREIEKKHR